MEQGLMQSSCRISYGGTQATDYMLKLMQLKYPTFPTKMTREQAQVRFDGNTSATEKYT